MKRKIFTYLSLMIAAVMLMFQNVTAVYAYDKPELKSASISKYGIYGIDASGKIFYWQYADDLAKQVMPDVKNPMHVEAADTRSDLGTRYLIGEYALTSDGSIYYRRVGDTSSQKMNISGVVQMCFGWNFATLVKNDGTLWYKPIRYSEVDLPTPTPFVQLKDFSNISRVFLYDVDDYLFYAAVSKDGKAWSFNENGGEKTALNGKLLEDVLSVPEQHFVKENGKNSYRTSEVILIQEDGTFQLELFDGTYTMKAADGQPFKPMLPDYMKTSSNQTNSPAAKTASPIKLFFNGEELKTDVAPIIENGRTYIPARVLYDAINNEDPADEYRIEWNEKDKTIKIICVFDYLLYPEITTTFTVGSKTVTDSYGDVTNKFEMTDPVIIRNNRALIPLRAVAEMLECEVNWDENARTVNIKYDVFGGMQG